MNLQISNQRGFGERGMERKKKKMVDAITLAAGYYYVSCRIISSLACYQILYHLKLNPLGQGVYAAWNPGMRNAYYTLTYLRARWTTSGYPRGHFFFFFFLNKGAANVHAALSSFWLTFNMRQVGAIFILVTFATWLTTGAWEIFVWRERVARKWDMSPVGEEF